MHTSMLHLNNEPNTGMHTIMLYLIPAKPLNTHTAIDAGKQLSIKLGHGICCTLDFFFSHLCYFTCEESWWFLASNMILFQILPRCMYISISLQSNN